MKGLLLKDWYLTKKYGRTLLILIVAFAIGGAFSGGLSFTTMYPCFIAGLLPITMLAYDEREKWNVYAQALPVTRALYVTEKYLFGTLSLGGYLVLAALVRLLAGMDAEAVAALLAISLTLGLTGPAIVLPFFLRFGPEKARILLYTLYAAAAGVMVWLMSGNAGIGGILSRGALSEGAFCLVAIALYVLSWRLSVALYRKKEF